VLSHSQKSSVHQKVVFPPAGMPIEFPPTGFSTEKSSNVVLWTTPHAVLRPDTRPRLPSYRYYVSIADLAIKSATHERNMRGG